MPSGRTHGAVTIAASVAITVIGFRYGYRAEDVFLMAGGCMTGIILSPDMDVDNGFLGNYVMDKLAGVIVGWVWQMLWKPYAFFISHRSMWSHFPIISTALRLLYCLILEWALSKTFNFKMYIPEWDIFIVFFYGLALSDALHWLADILSTATRSTRTAWTTVSDVRNVRRRSPSRTGSPSRTQQLTQAVVENWFISLLRKA